MIFTNNHNNLPEDLPVTLDRGDRGEDGGADQGAGALMGLEEAEPRRQVNHLHILQELAHDHLHLLHEVLVGHGGGEASERAGE